MSDFPSSLGQDLERIVQVSKAITAERDLDRLLALIVGAVTDLMQADRTSLFIVDRDAGQLWTRIAQGSGTIRLPLGSGIAGSVVTSGQTINIADAYADPRFSREQDRQSGYCTRSILCMPLVNHENKVVGAIQTLNKRGGGAFSDEDENRLAALCSYAAIAIENAQLIQLDLERQRLAQEMQWAQRIQRSLLPAHVPTFSGWRFAAWQRTCDQTGGDYYDFLEVPGAEAFDVLVGDVSGHGIGAALLMSSARAALRALHLYNESSSVLMRRLNELLENDMAQGSFMTLLLCRLSLLGGCSYVSAGHAPPLIYRARQDSFDPWEETGPLLGAVSNLHYDIIEVPPLAPGDVLVMVTDGILEAGGLGFAEQFGPERLRQCVRQFASLGAQCLAQNLVLAADRHRGKQTQADDMTIVVAERL